MPTQPPTAARLASIDALRGLVMVLMALDHVRDMLTQPRGAMLDFSEAAGLLFFTRWVTHFCAPTFVLLAGIGAHLYRAKTGSPRAAARFLLTRGLWLVVIELTVVAFAWNFNVGERMVLPLQVLWALGVSMIALAGLVWLPRSLVAVFGLVVVLGHNLLDSVQPALADASPLWVLLHIQGPLSIGGTIVAFVGYPLVPWIGLMALGYVLGPVFAAPEPSRPRTLVLWGVALAIAFIALRLPNAYGEPRGWEIGASLVPTLVSFFDLTKYPPSLQFLLMTVGPALAMLGVLEHARGRIVEALITIGRVPFFYYVLHLYVIHTLALIVGVAQGFAIGEIAVVFLMYPSGFGVGLGSVYLLWIAVVLALFPACRWFAAVKARRPEWWLSYL